MSTPQTFGTSLKTPWALVQFGSNQPNGRRPGTSVAYLTDDEGDHFLGGLVEFYRGRNDPAKCWHYRYKNARRFQKDEVLHVFPHTSRSPWGGPSESDVRRARKALPVNQSDEAVAA